MGELLSGKVALVTGGARGQGRAHAITSACAGADVILVDVVDQLTTVEYEMAKPEDLTETARQVEALGRRVLSIKADVRSQDELDQAVSHGIAAMGKIDILIANAGIWTLGPFWELSEEAWKEMIDVNLSGVWRAAKAVAPYMIAQGTGSIVMTASMNAHEPGQNYAHYVSAKHGVIGLMKSVALELAPHGIRCNAVSPGGINTPMTNNPVIWNMVAGHDHGTEEEYLAGGAYYHALKGAGALDPQVIADAALFLNSELASVITGVALPVDAGHLLLPGSNPNPVK